MTFLEKKDKSKTESFDQKMKVRPKGTQKAHNDMKVNFNKFCNTVCSGRSADEVLAEMVATKDTDIDMVYGVLQQWINYNDDNGIAASSISMWFSYLKKLIRHHGIKITSDDVKENLEFPKKQEEELYPLQVEEIKAILEIAKPKKRALYYALTGSAMRIGEAVQIRKRELDLETERITVHIPARITKLKKARDTFLSIEAKKAIMPKLEKLSDDDLVWGTNEDYYKAANNERVIFARYCEKAGLGMKYDSTGRHKINLHSFRAFFITNVSRHDENFAKKIAGQKGYMLQYDRLTLEEKLKLYLEVEPDLLIYSSFIKDKKIKRLKEANEKLQKQENRINELEKNSELKEKELEKRIRMLEKVRLDQD